MVARASRAAKDASVGRARVKPKYAEQFRCIGPACEDTCCHGWQIRLDEATYTRYQSLPQGPLVERLRQNLVLISEGQTKARYAEIRLDPQGVCPLLDPDRLCAIQKEYGAESLSRTCAQYPRSVQIVDGRSEETLLLSCPEAARLVLLHPQLVPEISLAGSKRYSEALKLCAVLPDSANNLKAYFPVLRRFSLLLLTDRSYPLWQRLFLLGMLSKRLETMVSQQQVAQTPRVLQEYAELAAAASLRPAMEMIPPQPELQLRAILTLLTERLQLRDPGLRLGECLHWFITGIGWQPGTSAELLTPAYQRAFSARYLPWRERNPLVLENYLVNAVLGHLFPIGPSGPMQGLQPMREYLYLAIHYGLVQGLLAAAAGCFPSGLETAQVVQLIQSFTKVFEHHADYTHRAIGLLERHGMNSTAGIAALIRDPVIQRVDAITAPQAF